MPKRRPSRCLDVANARQDIHWARVGDRFEVPLRELEAQLQAAIPAKQLIDILVWLDSTFERIAQCLAVDPDDVVPVAPHRDLWELRVDLSDSGFLDDVETPDKYEAANGTGPLVRIYEAEVNEVPQHLVALVAHMKIITNSQRKTTALQDAEITRAHTRFIAGRSTLWGLPQQA